MDIPVNRSFTDISVHGYFSPWIFQPMDISVHGKFLDISVCGLCYDSLYAITCDFSMVALNLSHMGEMSSLASLSLSPCWKNSSMIRPTHTWGRRASSRGAGGRGGGGGAQEDRRWCLPCNSREAWWGWRGQHNGPCSAEPGGGSIVSQSPLRTLQTVLPVSLPTCILSE